MRTFYVLNALVPPRGVGGMLVSPPYSWEEVKSLVAMLKRPRPDVEVVSAVGHPATAELLGVPCSSGEVFPVEGDVALVARLKRRVRGDVQVGPEDLEFRLVRYGPAACDDTWCLLMQGYHPDSFAGLFEETP